MENVQYEIKGTKLHITVDLSVQGGPSKSGKTTVIASTQGNQAISPGLYMGLNVYRKA